MRIISVSMPPSTKKSYRIASIPGDGIGPEVISAGITVLETLAAALGTFELRFEHFDWNSEYYKAHGKYLPDDALQSLKKFDAILFGAVGAPGTLCANCDNLILSLPRYLLTCHRQTFRTIFRFGGCDWPSVSPFNSMPMSDLQRLSGEPSLPYAIAPPATWTGS